MMVEFWKDNWLGDLGPFSNVLTSNGSGVPASSKVADSSPATLKWVRTMGVQYSVKVGLTDRNFNFRKLLSSEEQPRRHLTSDMGCAMCGVALESTSHVLRECPLAKICLGGSGENILLQSNRLVNEVMNTRLFSTQRMAQRSSHNQQNGVWQIPATALANYVARTTVPGVHGDDALQKLSNKRKVQETFKKGLKNSGLCCGGWCCSCALKFFRDDVHRPFLRVFLLCVFIVGSPTDVGPTNSAAVAVEMSPRLQVGSNADVGIEIVLVSTSVVLHESMLAFVQGMCAVDVLFDVVVRSFGLLRGSPIGFVASEAYEGEDEHKNASTSIHFSYFEFQAHVISSGESFDFTTKRVVSLNSFKIDTDEVFINLDENDDENIIDMIESAHICDPGIQSTEFSALPILKRSCSNLKTSNVKRMAVDQFLRKSRSLEELHGLSTRATNYFKAGIPASEMTCCNTDVVEPDLALNVGINLKVIPMISDFTSLRFVNLSNNFIVQVTPGSLPKGLHNLSKNKINNIEGLRELTRLRVLDLSYNHIARIGHGLSNCIDQRIVPCREQDRKLTVLGLNFNKMSMMKALGSLLPTTPHCKH
ncbi:Outer arm dynein light chain 1 protein [Hibiscus syriacus]|uniref:Outer arm dynein light chain 1 protein n=1 Tax=Hibiscus syriacus TaxID=106335 RepID=A0A6A3ANA8_HIBSY|nr:Outer arm dynein light chain 1 protein [Hibiscus syriacus]